MAWVFDAANTGATENDVNATVTISHTVGSLTNGILFVTMAWSTVGSTITGVTYNGVAMTQAIHQATNRSTDIWYLVAPDSGTHNVVISGSGNFGRANAGSQSWDGANASQTPTTITGNGTSATPSVTVTTAAGELIIDCLGQSFTAGDTLAVNANQTEQSKISGGATILGSSSQLGSDGGVMSWTNSNSRAYGFVAASFDPAAAGGTSILRQMMQHHGG